jgi:hypothetical protein
LVLVTLLRATNYKLKARLFLLFVSQDISIAFMILVALLKVEDYEVPIAGAVLRIAAELASPATHFSDDGLEMREFDITAAGNMVSEVVRHAKKADYFSAAADALGRQVTRETRRKKQGSEEGRDSARLFDGVTDLCAFLCGAYKFSLEERNIVQHVELTSYLLPRVLFPLLQDLGKAEMVLVNPDLSLSLYDVVPAVIGALDVLILASFCPMPQSRSALMRKENVIVVWLRDVPLLRTRKGISLTVRLLNINVNMDSLADGVVGAEEEEEGGDARDAIVCALRSFRDELDGDTLDALLGAFTGGSTPFPVSREHATYGLLVDTLRASSHSDTVVALDVGTGGGGGRAAQGVASGSGSGGPLVPLEFLCSLNGHIMKDPVTTPAGHSYERGTIVAWLQSRGSDPKNFAGAKLRLEDLKSNMELSNRILKWHISGSMKANKRYDQNSIYDF